MNVPAGEYKVWIFSHQPSQNYLGESLVKAAPDQLSEVRVTLGVGATIKGTVSAEKAKQSGGFLGF